MKRKTFLLLTISVIMAATVFAQTNRVSGGISAGTNYSYLKPSDEATGSNYDWKWKWGGVGGLYLNFPFGTNVSLQPSLLFSQMGSKYSYSFSDSLGTYSNKLTQKLGYISVPVPLKINAGNHFAFLVGPQFDFLVGAKIKDQNDNTTDNKDNFKKFDFALTGGIQLMANSPVSLTIRYMQGLSNLMETSNNSYNQTFGAGKLHNSGVQATLNFRLFGAKEKSVAVTTPQVPAVLDSDNDGIPDDQDKCPNTPGVAKYNGCPVPDTDGDGINDDNDKCPTVPGVAKYNGCPVPDTDGDGINDDNDKCPTVPGVERYQGCPIPDSDNDGINDEEDNCPHLAGTAANHGCPEVDASTQSKVDMMAKSVSWNSSTGYTLAGRSNKSLDQVANMLVADPNLKVTISVHTGTTGDAAKTLSQNRADAVKSYLVSKGVKDSQIEATGYGGEQPIADTKTAAGRAKNQRTEIKLHY
jgi:outer membrane protein OmpA-like peptidoglycan-associated protein